MQESRRYSPYNRSERVITAARLFLAIFLTLALVLDPWSPGHDSGVLLTLALSYVTYSIGIATLTWTQRVTTRGVPIATHVVDLLLFTVFMYLSPRREGPFFPYFVFVTICGAIRWHGRGALITGGAALAAYVGAAALSGDSGLPEGFYAPQFIARCSLLALVAGMLAYVGFSQERLQREINSLAAWPRRLPTSAPEALDEVLTYAAAVLETGRVILVWEEADEPSLRIASRQGDRFELARERPDAFGTIVAQSLARSSFVCSALGNGSCRVLQRVPGGFRFWTGEPLDANFRARYQVKSVVALRLTSDNIEGWLFALDRRQALAEDLLLGDIVGRLVAGALELQTLLNQLRESAAGEERVNLARELHDGVLQALTAASLQAQRTRQAVTQSPADAERNLQRLEEMILAEQQALRRSINDLKPGAIRENTPVDPIARVREAATRVGMQWDVNVHLDLGRDVPSVAQNTAHELTRMVQEAVVNAIRHGGARDVKVACGAQGNDLVLTVSYEGHGFAGLKGRHDLAALNEMKSGPRTLKERVGKAGGSLLIDSGDRGALVEIRLPFTLTR